MIYLGRRSGTANSHTKYLRRQAEATLPTLLAPSQFFLPFLPMSLPTHSWLLRSDPNTAEPVSLDIQVRRLCWGWRFHHPSLESTETHRQIRQSISAYGQYHSGLNTATTNLWFVAFSLNVPVTSTPRKGIRTSHIIPIPFRTKIRGGEEKITWPKIGNPLPKKPKLKFFNQTINKQELLSLRRLSGSWCTYKEVCITVPAVKIHFVAHISTLHLSAVMDASHFAGKYSHKILQWKETIDTAENYYR